MSETGSSRNAVPGGLAVVLAAMLSAGTAFAAPQIKPWVPSDLDSLSVWAAQARAMFRANTGDSLGGTNFLAYQVVGKMGRQLLRSLGRRNLSQSYAAEPVIDSLGLDTEICTDPSMPSFALMMARNPFRPTADVVGFMYWFQGNDLRMQGVRFTSGRGLLMRVWRHNDPEKPYSWGIVENAGYGSKPLEFSLLRLASTGFFWTADQYPGNGPDVGGRGDATFADINNDGIPELITWSSATEDTLFTVCRECPTLITERTWSERRSGFELVESRLIPSAYANFVLFVRFLRDGNRAAASRLLADPAKVTEAIANGWGRTGPGANWRVMAAEPDQRWPHWLEVRHGRGEQGRSWIVNFVVKDGRWIIQDWMLQKNPTPQVRAR